MTDFTDPASIKMEDLLEYQRLKDLEKLCKDEWQQTKNDREALEETIALSMDNAGMRSASSDTHTFYRRTDTYMSIRKEDKEAAHQWLITHGEGGIIQETVNSRTLTSTMKEYAENGGDIPDFIRVSVKNRVGLKKR